MDSPEHEKKADVRRPMNAFLIFCKRHRSMVREKNPDLDNRSVTRILGDLWANLGETEKSVYTTLAKQYKDAFMKANPDYKWHNPDKTHQTPTKMTTRPTNARVVKSAQDIHLDGSIMPGKLADPSKMGGLSLLLMAGQQSMAPRQGVAETERRLTSPDKCSTSKSALLELAEMCANELQQEETTFPHPRKHTTKTDGGKKGKAVPKKHLWLGDPELMKGRSKSESDSGPVDPLGGHQPLADILKLVQVVKEQDAKTKLLYPKEQLTSQSGNKEAEHEGNVSVKSGACWSESFTDESLGGRSTVGRMFQRPAQRIRSWSESAKEDHSPCFAEDMSDHSSYTIVKARDDSQPRRQSHSETLAGCLSDQNDNAIVSCGKLVVDHIVDRLFSTDIARAAMKLKGVTSIEELKKALMSGGLTDAKSLGGEGSQDGKLVHSRIDRLVAEVYAKEKCETETKEMDVVKKEYEPILRVPDVKSFLETNESTQKRSSSETFSSDGNSEVQAKKRLMTLPLEEIKSEPVNDQEHSVITPETKGDKSDQDNPCGDDDGKERDESGAYQPVRKSRRRNRGQRYLELINEGIIQPSKERLAARRAEQTSTEDESLWCYEDMLMEEEIMEVRRPAPKRSGSDSDALIDEKKYKTGDFDLEAQIATLPACSLDPVSRNRQKNVPGKTRHHSEGSGKKSATVTSPTSALAITDMTTLTLPPHVKLQAEPISIQPVSGSRKRKARKHSINHLLPVGSCPDEKDKKNDENAELKKDSEGEDGTECLENLESQSEVGIQETQKAETGSDVQKGDGQMSSDSSDQSNTDSGSCDTTDKGGSTEASADLNLEEKADGFKSEGGVSKFGCETSQSAGGSHAQASSPSQSTTASHVQMNQLESSSPGSSVKGCDKNANINTSESDVLDFRTSKIFPDSLVKDRITVAVPSRSDKPEAKISEFSLGSAPHPVQSNITQAMQSQSIMKYSGSCNLSEVRNTSVSWEKEAYLQTVDWGSTKGDNSYESRLNMLQAPKSQLDSSGVSQEVFRPADVLSPLTISSDKQGEMGQKNYPSETQVVSDNKPRDPSSPTTQSPSPSESFPSTSAVNIVAFSSASAPSTVDLVTLSSTAVTQAVNLEVLAERADDSPSSSITRSPLAAGSPSVGIVHS